SVVGECVIHGGSALRTEVEVRLASRIANPHVAVRFSRCGDGRGRKTSLSGKDATRAALASEAMADGNAYRVADDGGSQLTARTGGNARDWHGRISLHLGYR